MKTPTTPNGIMQYDHYTPRMAAYLAWTDEGRHGFWHRRAQRYVRRKISKTLAKALDKHDFNVAVKWYYGARQEDRVKLFNTMPLVSRALVRGLEGMYK